MKHRLATALAICALGAGLDAQDQPTEPATLKVLEKHVLENPGFERPFYDLLAEGLDDPEWQNLDARWEKRAATDTRHCLLRGLLAERLGKFETALGHYERAKTLEWGAYHHARLLAFLGKVEPARQALLQLARKTRQPWIFNEAARGVGELILLTEDTVQAESHYAALWDSRVELQMRMSLMEPLLTLRMELGTGREWLNKMEPHFDPKNLSATTSETDRALLWFWGASLTQMPVGRFSGAPLFLREHDIYLHAERLAPPDAPWFPRLASHADVGRWYADLAREMRTPMSPCPAATLATSLARQKDIDPEAVEQTLFFATMEGAESLAQVAETLKPALRENPALLSTALRTWPDVVAEAREDLERRVFAGSAHPLWRLWSLVMRSMHSKEKPEALSGEAHALWQQTAAHQLLSPPHARLSKARGIQALPTLTHYSTVTARPGVVEPVSGVIWNLRGDSFSRAMAVRFRYELEKTFWQTSIVRNAVVRTGNEASMADFVEVESTLEARAVLWHMRKELGLDMAKLEAPKTVTERAMDVLVRGAADAISEFATQEPELRMLPPRWLLALRQAVNTRQSLQRYDGSRPPPPEPGLDHTSLANTDFGPAARRLDETLVAHLAGWVLPSLRAGLPLAQPVVLNADQQRELLVCHHRSTASNSKPDTDTAKATRAETWKQLVPATADAKSLGFELLRAQRSLQADELPHALWGLQWQPSLRREQALLSRSHDPAYQIKPPFLTETLPKQIKQAEPPKLARPDVYSQQDHDRWRQDAREAALPKSSRDLLNQVAFKMVTRFGFAMLKPQPARMDELRSMAAKHPFAKDLVAVWEALDTRGKVPELMPPFTPYQLAPEKVMSVLEALQQTASRDTRLLLMVLHQRYGDTEKARPFEAEFKDLLTEAPAVRVVTGAPGRADMMLGIPGMTNATNVTVLTPEKLVERAIKSQQEDEFFQKGVSGMEPVLRETYEWLKKQDKTAPAFATKTGALAALARRLKVPEQERTEAEELDLRLHPEDTTRWLRCAVSRANAGQEKEALDAFFEALKRMDLSTQDRQLRDFQPQGLFWENRAVDARRTDELAAALNAALARTPDNAAREMTAKMVQAVAKDVTEKPEPLIGLLRQVLKHQRHLILPSFTRLNETVEALEKAGKTEAATLVARTMLQGLWTGARTPASFASSRVDDLPYDVHKALEKWSQANVRDEVGPKSAMEPLFDKALRGADSAAFVQELAVGAAAFPKDEQLVSCAVVAKVMQGAAVEEALRLAEGLEPQARMRVAWRVCELAQPPPKELAKLAPALARGLEALFQDKSYLEGGSRHLLLAAKLLPWLEQGKADAEIQTLLPVFARSMENSPVPRDQWPQWIEIAQRNKATGLVTSISKSWTRECEEVMAGENDDEGWYYGTINQLCTLAAGLDAESAHPFAVLADEVWSGLMKTHAGRVDPPSGYATQLCDLLVSYGETERLKVLISNIETLLRLGAPQDYERLLERAREGLEFLRTPERLAMPAVWVEDAPEDQTTGKVHWNLTTPLPNGNLVMLKRLTKKHHLKLLAGASFDALRPVAEELQIAASGMVEVKNMPSAGFVQGVLCDDTSQFVSIGHTALYSLRHSLLDSADEPGATLPEWRDEWLKVYGHPISKVAPVDGGLSVLADQLAERQASSNRSYAQLHIVALDENKKPLGSWGLGDARSSRSFQAYSGRSPVLSMATPYHTPLQPMEKQARPSHIMLTMVNEDGARKPPYRVQVRAFHHREPPVDVNLPELEHTALATVGFAIRSWQLSEDHPRAVFYGDDQVVLFDTDASPWRELLRLRDAKLREGGWVFMLSPDVACFSQMDPSSGSPRLWQLRCSGAAPAPATLKDCPEMTLPLSPQHVEVSPKEDAVLYLATSDPRALEVTWLDSSYRTSTLKIERTLQQQEKQSSPFIAWWPAGGKDVVIEENGIQFHVTKTPEELQLVKMEPRSVTSATVPGGTAPGQRLTSAMWLLKGGNTLLQMDPKTRRPRQAYKLPDASYTGNPLWWGRRHQSVLLQTNGMDLIMVQPQEAGQRR